MNLYHVLFQMPGALLRRTDPVMENDLQNHSAASELSASGKTDEASV